MSFESIHGKTTIVLPVTKRRKKCRPEKLPEIRHVRVVVKRMIRAPDANGLAAERLAQAARVMHTTRSDPGQSVFRPAELAFQLAQRIVNRFS